MASIEAIREAWDAVGGTHEAVGIDDAVTVQYHMVQDAIEELARLRALPPAKKAVGLW
jgi:hypothetical protein